MLFQTVLENPVEGIILLGALIISLGLHEAAHAYSAYWLGDPTPKIQGRTTLNPLNHLDPIGSLFILFAGIGWGRPVEFNPYNLKNPQKDAAIIAFAGPLINIVIALIGSALIYFLYSAGSGYQLLFDALIRLVALNVALAVFNMIPVDPLDGFKVVGGILPPHLAMKWYETQQYGIYILMFLLLTGGISRIVQPINTLVLGLILGYF